MPNTFANSQQSHGSPDASASQNTTTRSVLSTLAEMREQLLVVTRAAEHNLCIYTASLCASLYGQPIFLEALKCLVLARRYARVRILTSTTPDAASSRHVLLSMAERLPSLMEVRAVPSHLLGTAEFVVADSRALIYRIRNDGWDGIVALNNPAVAKYYLCQFDVAWQAAHADDAAPPN